MQFLIIVFFCMMASFTHGQNSSNHPRAITEKDRQVFLNSIEKEENKLRKFLFDKKYSHLLMEFSIDTFRIHKLAEKEIDIDYSTSGMNESMSRMIDSYDKLLNKYYQRLMKKLKNEDQKILVNAQKAWLAYRDAESKLIATMSDEQYSGGGTIQSNIRHSRYLDLIMQRTNEVFNHLCGMMEDE